MNQIKLKRMRLIVDYVFITPSLDIDYRLIKDIANDVK